MNEPAIRVERLSKRYRLGEMTTGQAMLRERLMGLGRRRARTPDRELWALRGVSFDVPRGQALGIIGRNGAGKSTLLKVLSRITEPTSGRVMVAGQLASLLEVGAGFHHELTGRENIYLNGSILGMTRQQIRARFDEIVAFAEVEDFLDTPVKRYSSGMYTRLAFAVAAHLEPDVLVVDEVLAVGDAAFAAKCLGRMKQVAGQGRTVLFVSHQMSMIRTLCDRALLMERGEITADGKPAQVIERYLAAGVNPGGEVVPDTHDPASPFQLLAASLIDTAQGPTLRIDFAFTRPVDHARVGFMITTADGLDLFEAYDSDTHAQVRPRTPGRYRLQTPLPVGLLAPGRYFITLNAGQPRRRNFICLHHALCFTVEDTAAATADLQIHRVGLIRPTLPWHEETIDHAMAA